MAHYNIESRLADAIMDNPQLIPVVNRLGITLGVGEGSIGSICTSACVDPDFFLSVVNTFIDADYFPANPRGSFSLSKTIDYLAKTSDYYLVVQLPNIDRHFGSLLARSGNDNNLSLLRDFYEDMRRQMADCLRNDIDSLFPSLGRGIRPGNYRDLIARHNDIEAKLHDLLYFFVVHLRGSYDANLCMAVVSAVFSLDKDYSQNNRIRSRILLPAMEEMRQG